MATQPHAYLLPFPNSTKANVENKKMHLPTKTRKMSDDNRWSFLSILQVTDYNIGKVLPTLVEVFF